MRVSKGEMAAILGVSRSTIDEWTRRYDDLPVIERGGQGKEWVFDSDAVVAWFKARKSSEEAKLADRAERLSQLMLPAPAVPAKVGADVISIDDRIKAERLNSLRIANAVRARELVSVAEVREIMISYVTMMGNRLESLVKEANREMGIPELIAARTTKRVEEFRRRQVADIDAALRGVPANLTLERSELQEGLFANLNDDDPPPHAA